MKKNNARLSITTIIVITPLIGLIVAGLYLWQTAGTFNTIKADNMTTAALAESVSDSVFWIPDTDTISARYEVDGQEYTAHILAEKGSVHEGDTITLYYNAQKPNEASTEDNYRYLINTYKTEMLILGAVFVVFLLLKLLFRRIKATGAKKDPVEPSS